MVSTLVSVERDTFTGGRAVVIADERVAGVGTVLRAAAVFGELDGKLIPLGVGF